MTMPGLIARRAAAFGRISGVGVIVAGMLFGAGGSASAGTCQEAVDQLAQAYALKVDPPNASPPGARQGMPLGSPKAGDLGASGGVIEPPPVNDPAVIEPRGDVRYGMPTLPNVKSDSAPAAADRGAPLAAKDLAILESLLVAARGEAKRGNEADCFKRLQKAQEFLAEKGR